MKMAAAALLLMVAPAAAENSGLKMGRMITKIHACVDRQALAMAPKPVDLETASVAVLARCEPEMTALRGFLYTGIPNFTPNPDFWEKDIEPSWIKEARKAVSLARTRDIPAPRPKPPVRPNNQNQI